MQSCQLFFLSARSVHCELARHGQLDSLIGSFFYGFHELWIIIFLVFEKKTGTLQVTSPLVICNEIYYDKWSIDFKVRWIGWTNGVYPDNPIKWDSILIEFDFKLVVYAAGSFLPYTYRLVSPSGEIRMNRLLAIVDRYRQFVMPYLSTQSKGGNWVSSQVLFWDFAHVCINVYKIYTKKIENK